MIEMEMDMIMELHNQRKSKQRRHHQNVGGGILSNRINDLDVYDGRASLSKRGPVTVRKSNSRVSSTGKLRLRVESFRNTSTSSNGDNTIKNSSGTQTDISVLKQRGQDTSAHSSPKINQEITDVAPMHQTDLQTHTQGKYTGQYKKHSAPPNKPARKSKQSPSGNNSSGNRNGIIGSNTSNGATSNTSENRSDRSTSPDNSSTSGYSSPSAGVHSKESSPCGSKIPSPPQSMEESEGNITIEEQPMPINLNKDTTDEVNDEENNQSIDSDHRQDNENLVDESPENDIRRGKYEEEEKSKITVIQIVPTTAGGRDANNSDVSGQNAETPRFISQHYQTSSSSTEDAYDGSKSAEDISKEVPPSIPPQKFFHYHRELPRIATNGTLSRPAPSQQQPSYQPQYQPKRKLPLPDRTKLPPPPPDPLNSTRMNNNHSQLGNGILSNSNINSLPHTSSTTSGSSNSNVNSTTNNNKTQQPSSSSLPSGASSSSQSSSVSNGSISNGQQRLFRSNLPRPAPIHNFGHQSGRSVPLPPVPELDRSDHERESLSPVPEASQHEPNTVHQPTLRPNQQPSMINHQNHNHLHYNNSNGNSNRYQPQHLSKLRPLPSPLTTPIQPAERIIQPRPRRFGGSSGGERHAELPQIPTQQNNR